jgi:predicted RNA-binding Zn-ribbon protein involved in translation (DUF1610 family)
MTIKSRPLYLPFRLDPQGRAHLLVSDSAQTPDDIDALANIDIWTVQTIAPGIQAPIAENRRAFRAVAELLSHLKHRLVRETVGLRLYALGAESFLWDVHNLGLSTGLTAHEIFLTHSGNFARRVYCTHCKTMIETVTHNIHPCPGCGASLFVRDHFSRRLAAFMGVKIDAEIPGDIPEPALLTS